MELLRTPDRRYDLALALLLCRRQRARHLETIHHTRRSILSSANVLLHLKNRRHPLIHLSERGLYPLHLLGRRVPGSNRHRLQDVGRSTHAFIRTPAGRKSSTRLLFFIPRQDRCRRSPFWTRLTAVPTSRRYLLDAHGAPLLQKGQRQNQ